MSESEFPLPPPTFEFLVFSLKTQAEMQLGLFTLGQEKQEQPDLPAARHAIDMLAMIQEKTRGNLSLEEQRMIENSLTELRFRFIQVSEKTAQKAAEAPDANLEGSAPAS
jgi:flagellar motor protein MotB